LNCCRFAPASQVELFYQSLHFIFELLSLRSSIPSRALLPKPSFYFWIAVASLQHPKSSSFTKTFILFLDCCRFAPASQVELFYQSLSKSADEEEIHQHSLAFIILASLRK
jgi:hypothetical protein